MPVAASIRNAPVLLPGLEFYMTAFMDLSSCRQIGFDVGPIPFTAVSEYASRYDITGEQFHVFWALIKQMDAAYLKHRADSRKK